MIAARASLAVCLAALGLSLQSAAAQPAATGGETLSVCLQRNNPPLSVRGTDHPGGFTLALSQAVADRLGRPLRVQWFVSRDDPDSNLTKDANALLSDGRCQLVGDYALMADALGPPYAPTAKLPPYEGAGPDDRRRWVKIGTVIATRPYRFDALTIVLPAGGSGRTIRRLADLDRLRLGVETATLADAIAMRYDNERLAEHVVHVPDARDLFTRLEHGELDAAFVGLHEFDAWRLKHPDDGLVASGYRHSIGFNIGFAALEQNRVLVDQVNGVLSDLQGHGALPALAQGAGLTYLPPREPAVAQSVPLSALGGD